MHQSVLVTGAAKRTGKVIAQFLAAQGYHIILHCHRSKHDAEDTLREITAQGGSGNIVICDLGDYDAVETMITTLGAQTPPLRHIINNASLFEDDSLLNFTEQSFQRHMDVNCRSILQLSRGLHRLIPDGEEGSVCTVIDNKIFAMNADFFSYTISKYALSGATEAMALALAPRLRVNGIAPGLMLLSGDQSEENFALSRKMNPRQKPTEVTDIARTALYLIQTESLNGAIIPVDSGQRLMSGDRDIARLTADILKETP
ncbi:SDR family NAD(P)-dependent oxidoreductase [Paremcibacter congregatus]|uniref:SDR family NAD(P)-dependent oxidoreductase n=1 Tax=Paremcibacter congregatus TaxID=2043170 RepID=UPI003A92767B